MTFEKHTRVYISGCGGMLGRAVYEFFNERTTVKATDIDLNIAWLSYVRIREPCDVQIDIRGLDCSSFVEEFVNCSSKHTAATGDIDARVLLECHDIVLNLKLLCTAFSRL